MNIGPLQAQPMYAPAHPDFRVIEKSDLETIQRRCISVIMDTPIIIRVNKCPPVFGFQDWVGTKVQSGDTIRTIFPWNQCNDPQEKVMGDVIIDIPLRDDIADDRDRLIVELTEPEVLTAY